MADQSTTDLKYGHFGQIIYNPEDQAWLFPRSLESSSTLKPLGTSQLVFQSQRSQPRPDPVPTEKPSVHLNRQIAELLHFDPTVAPSAHLLIEPALVSQEIQKIVTRHDPTNGHLLAFGRVPDHAIKRSMPIIAFPAADHAHVLRLIQVQPQKHGWERNKSIWIEVPRISGESGTWHAPQPIRQICFADADEDSNLARTIAVRTTTAVHVLRVAARKHASSWNALTGTPSRFHTDQLCTLNLDLFGGLAPTHVAFNHWYPKQFITVDQYGTWHVWDSSLRQIPSEHGKPIELCRGATNDQAIPDEETTTSLLDDGWGRALWAGNVQTIITASRRCLGIYDIQAKPVRLQSSDLGIAGTPHWILDIMLNPLDPTLVFVLTSVSLFCLRVRCLDEFDPESYSTAGAEVVLQCRHFRDSEDTGLGLSNFVDDTDVVVFIKSSLSPLATSLRFTPDESSPQFLKVADATKLILPELPTTTSSAALTFQIQPAEYGESVHHQQPSGPGKLYRDLSMRFFVATAITSDMAVVQKLYYASSSTIAKSSLPEVAPPDWRGRLVKSHPRLHETDFVAQSLANQGLGNAREEQDGILAPHVNSLKSTRDDWTMLYELSHARATGAASRTEDFSHTISRVEQALQAPEPTHGGPQLLSEIFDDQVLVSDIDQAAAEFKDMILSKTERGQDVEEIDQMLRLARIGYSTLGIGLDSDMDLMAVYDNIVAHWLTPLSQTVPGRVRLVKEQLARRIAAGICLASHVLRQPPVKPSEETLPETQATEEAYSFPQSSLPTPSPTATPSLTTVTSLSSHPSTLVSPEFARLQRYTTFSPDKATPGPLPKGLTNTLAHWRLGSNPEKYDWLAVQREQEKKAEEEDEDLTPRERARLKRRAEKLLDKQRREAQKASAMSLANSQVPGIVSASQPAFMTPSRSEGPNVPHSARAASQGTQLLASSQAAPNMFTSQIQPGKFGGKPAKKKRRVVGF